MLEQLMRYWLAAAALAPQAPPPAQTPVTTTVVVTASLVPTPESATARTVTTLPRLELDALGVASPVDALRLLTGLDVRSRGPQDVQADLSVRGATFGQQLVLVDGVRINDAQSGHHNGEFPIPVVALDRIEVVAGAASAIHGADALGGAINLITRRDDHAALAASAGEHDFAALSASLGGHGLPAHWTLSGWTQRSTGFMFDRDFAIGGGLLRGNIGRGVTFDVRHQRRAFGANGFYGASPSKEWTDLTLATLGWSETRDAWTTSVRGTFKNHGDHFRWDIARPGFAENRHRTNAGEIVVSASRRTADGVTFTAGASSGIDLVRSSNLGDHDFSRAGAFAEVLAPVTPHVMLQGAIRADHYSAFGSQVSPTMSAIYANENGWRVRGSLGRAFRVPTFTELYYLDPNNEGNADLKAERGWSADVGLDFARAGWSASLTPFVRWDSDVIDYVRPSAAVRWHAENVRDVTTRGLEVAAARRWQDGLVKLSYTALDVDAPTLSLLSKYVLEYARHSLALSAAAPLGVADLRASVTADHRQRLDGQRYTLVGAQLSRVFSRATVFVAASNLLNETYREVAGVDMPGRWFTVGIAVR